MRSIVKILVFVGILLSLSKASLAYREFPEFSTLSPYSKISLLTCDPGNQLYTTFGHSAIRVYDPMQNRDIVFNYGTFNFNVPHFYLKFASGKLLYNLSYETYRQFMAMYVYEHRTVIEQELNLTLVQRQLLLDDIRENYKIENRFYKYDFFFDNCATRIIALFSHTLGDSLIYKQEGAVEAKTFRELLNEYLHSSHWSDVAISLLLGKVTDVDATELQKAFLPDYLLKYCENLWIGEQPFVQQKIYLLKGTFVMPKTPFLYSPYFIFWFLFALVLVLSFIFRKKTWNIADRSIFIFFGIVGLVVALATFATDHGALKQNMNLVWVHPLYIVLAGFIGTKHRKLVFYTSSTFLFINMLVLAGWFILPQSFHVLFIPIILIITLRLSIIALRTR